MMRALCAFARPVAGRDNSLPDLPPPCRGRTAPVSLSRSAKVGNGDQKKIWKVCVNRAPAPKRARHHMADDGRQRGPPGKDDRFRLLTGKARNRLGSGPSGVRGQPDPVGVNDRPPSFVRLLPDGFGESAQFAPQSMHLIKQ